eukprot:scaffold14385_cov14-Tisochrysis_lutea.AAC.1
MRHCPVCRVNFVLSSAQIWNSSMQVLAFLNLGEHQQQAKPFNVHAILRSELPPTAAGPISKDSCNLKTQ